ncbi:MAG TPA: ABC transporter permease, partial [Bacteroidales bacterium]|nr:ABC transporter permease [Bacteroidales bacterium]
FAFVLADYTGLNMTGSLIAVDDFGRGEYLALNNLILPALTLGIRPLAVVTELTRSSMANVMAQDFIRTARAKGLSLYRVVTGHALRNALNPVVTAISGWFASLMAGAVFVEFVFGWKGIGVVIVDALEHYDFPVVMGAVLIISMMLVVVNIIVDMIYGLLDPRIRMQ